MRLENEMVPIGTAVVTLRHKRRGIVKWCGNLHNKQGIWYGLELEEGGIHDGTLEGVRYFKCPDRLGLFIARSGFRISSRRAPNLSAPATEEPRSCYFREKVVNHRMYHSPQYNQDETFRSPSDASCGISIIPQSKRSEQPKRICTDPSLTISHVKSRKIGKIERPGSFCGCTDSRFSINCRRQPALQGTVLSRRQSQGRGFAQTPLHNIPSVHSLTLPPRPPVEHHIMKDMPSLDHQQTLHSPKCLIESDVLKNSWASTCDEMGSDEKSHILISDSVLRSLEDESSNPIRLAVLKIAEQKAEEIINARIDQLVKGKVSKYIEAGANMNSNRIDDLEKQFSVTVTGISARLTEIEQSLQENNMEVPKLRKVLFDLHNMAELTESVIQKERNEHAQTVEMLLQQLQNDNFNLSC